MVQVSRCVVAALSFSAFALPASAQPVSTDTDLVVLSRRVETDYLATPETLAAVASAAVPASITIRRGDTLSGIVSRLYGLGQSRGGEAYASMETFVRKSNGLSSEALVAGSPLVVPDLPRQALTAPNPNNPNNRIAKLNINGALLSGRFENLRLQQGRLEDNLVIDDLRVGAKEQVVYRVVTRAEAERLRALDPNYKVELAQVNVTLAQHPSSTAADTLSPDEFNRLRTRLAEPVQQRPVLFILDDSWPDDEEFRRSRDFVVAAIKAVREDRRLPPAQMSQAFLTASTAGPPSLDVTGERHSDQIKRSLRSLQSAEPADGRVRVIYLPIFRAQSWNAELLEQIVALNLLIRHIGQNNGDDLPSIVNLSKKYQSMARTLVGSLGTSVNGKLSRSDVSVIQALLWFCQYQSDVAQQPFVTSMSWTMPASAMEPSVPHKTRGLFVTAAGNKGSSPPASTDQNVYQLERQFASRSRYPGDMLTVMNVAADGAPDCRSTPLGPVDDEFVAAFSGQVDGSVCGTSFSAPRVGWLLAAREAVRSGPADPRYLSFKVRRELKEMRDGSRSNYGRYRVNILNLF